MNPIIDAKIRSIRLRLRVLSFYRGAMLGASIGTLVAGLVLLTDKFFPLKLKTSEQWAVWAGLMAAGVAAAAIYALLRRITPLHAALEADMRLGLQERLSSAVALRERAGASANDPALTAMLEDARTAAARVHPSEHFPFELPRRSIHLLWPYLALPAIVFLMPRVNLFASETPKAPSANAVAPEVRKENVEKIRKISEKIRKDAKTNDDKIVKYSKELDKIAQDLEFSRMDEKTAMAEMSRVSDDVRLQRQDLAKKFENFQMMNLPGQDNKTRDLQKAMQNNQFEKAAQMAQQMGEQALKDAAATSADDKAQMAKEFQQMASQLSKDQPDLAKAMQSAASTMQKAAEAQKSGDKAAMNQAMSQMQKSMSQASESLMSQSEAASLMNKLDSLQQNMDQQRREMARSSGMNNQCQQCQGKGCKACNGTGKQQGGQAKQGQGQGKGQKDGKGQQGQGKGQGQGQGQGKGQSPGDEKSESAQGDSSGQNSQFGDQQGRGQGGNPSTGEWSQGMTDRSGAGMGGPGRGQGGEAKYDDSNPPQFVDTKVPGVKNQGEIIAVMKVDGPALKGESQIQYQQVFTEYRQKADDAIQREDIPSGYKNLVKDYLDSISPERRAPAAGGAARPQGAPASAPAQPQGATNQ